MAAVRTITAAEYIEAGLMWRMPRPALPLAPRGWSVLEISDNHEGDKLRIRWATPEGEVTKVYAATDELKVRF